MTTSQAKSTQAAVVRRQIDEASLLFGDDAALHERLSALRLAVDALPNGPESEALRILIEVQHAVGGSRQGDVQRAFRRLMPCMARADRLGDKDVQASVWLEMSNIFSLTGRQEEARTWLERASALEPSAEIAVRIRVNLASRLRAAGMLHQSVEAFEQVLQHSSYMPPSVEAGAQINAASAWWQVGKHERAEAALHRARSLLTPADGTMLSAWIFAIGAWVACAAGDHELAIRRSRRAFDMAPTLDVASSAGRALGRVAVMRVDDSLAEEASHAMLHTLEQAENAGRIKVAHDLHEALAELCTHGGDLVGEVRHLRRVKQLADELNALARQMSLEHDDLRVEVARVQAEVDVLRANRQQLAHLNQALVRADVARVRLLRTVAHDLRNPLTSLLAAVDLIDPSDSSNVREFMQHIDVAATKMAELLDVALTPDSAQQGRVPVQVSQVDVVHIAEATVRSFRALASQKQQSIRLLSPRALLTQIDRIALARILDNLVSNAIKFTGKGSEVEVEILPSSDHMDIWVRDSGPGFANAHTNIGLLFGAQLNDVGTEGETGWGIGLHTVYSLVSSLGGTVSMSNREQGGAVVHVCLPRVD